MDGDQQLPLGGRALAVLEVLVHRAGSTVPKDDLLAAAWPDVTVQEGSLRVQIALLRKALADGENGRRLIVNDAGRGYSLAVPVDRRHAGEAVWLSRSSMAPADNLPAVLTRVVGREGPISQIETDLSRARLVSVVGPGGIGKTTVALSAAAVMRSQYKDGVWFVDLAPVADPALVSSVVASSLGLSVTPGDPAPDLISFLRDKQLLLLFDNCEHVIDVTATLAEAILSRAPKVQILATSREPLRAHGERVHHLGPLEIPPDSADLEAEAVSRFASVQLFLDRMNAAIGDHLVSNGELLAVAQICRRLDGIALAIELAAGQVDTLGIAGIAAELDDRFDLLSRGLRTATPRHRTLSAVYDWSYLLLTPGSQAVFRRLSVFAGVFSLDAARAVAADGLVGLDDVTGHVAKLVAASLVVADVTNEPVCYRLLETSRAYGQSRLAECGETDATRRRHAEFYLQHFEKARVQAAGWPSARWVQTYKPQLDNLRVALDWTGAVGDWTLRDRLTLAAVPLLTHLSLNWECRTRVNAALTERPVGVLPDDRCEMELLSALGMSLLFTYGGAEPVWTRCLAAAERLGDTDQQLRALKALWTLAFSSANRHAAAPLAARFKAVAGPSPHFENRLMLERMLSMDLFYSGRLVEAAPIFRSIYDAYATGTRGTDVLRFQFDQTVMAAVNLSVVTWLRGFPDQAMAMARQALAVAETVDHDLSRTYALSYSACRIAIANGDYASAETWLGQLSEQADRDQSSHWGLFVQLWKGTLLNRRGDPRSAARYLSAALQSIPQGSMALHQTLFLGEHAHAIAQLGDHAGAAAEIQEAIVVCDRLDEKWCYAELLRLQGDIALLSGDARREPFARETYSQALAFAAGQGALSFELRAATCLARLDVGNAAGHFTRLQQTYARFTEGFDTPDLVDARRILEASPGV